MSRKLDYRRNAQRSRLARENREQRITDYTDELELPNKLRRSLDELAQLVKKTDGDA